MTYHFVLTRIVWQKENMGLMFWQIPRSGVGRWVNDEAKAKVYTSERAVHIAWTAASKKYPFVQCVPVGCEVQGGKR